MGMLDALVGQVTSALSGPSGGNSPLVNSVLGMLTNQPGGLQGLIQTMREKGLGQVAESWIGTGANQAITPEQIQQVLGNQKIQEFAQAHGLDVNQISAHLAQILPVAVDKLTPDGHLPTAGGVAGGVMDALKGFMPGSGS